MGRVSVFISVDVYRGGQSDGNADRLNRLSLPTEVKNVAIPGGIMFVMDHLGN